MLFGDWTLPVKSENHYDEQAKAIYKTDNKRSPWAFCEKCHIAYPRESIIEHFLMYHYERHCSHCGEVLYVDELKDNSSHSYAHHNYPHKGNCPAYKYPCSKCNRLHKTRMAAKHCCQYYCTVCDSFYDDYTTAQKCCAKYPCPECGRKYKDRSDAAWCCHHSCEYECHGYHNGVCECGDVDYDHECEYCEDDREPYVPSNYKLSETSLHVDEPAPRFEFESRYVAVDIADFYLLEYLGVVLNYRPALERLKRFEKWLAKEWYLYLDLAVGGELRHASSYYAPEDIKEYLWASHDRSRSKGWRLWKPIRERYGTRALELAIETFETPECWSSKGYGGRAWAGVAKVVLAYAKGQLPDRIFIDRACSLEHNGGCVFDKAYLTNWAATVLEAHAEGDIDTLLKYASPIVKNLWRAYNVRKLEGRTAEYRLMADPDNYCVTENDCAEWEEVALSHRNVGLVAVNRRFLRTEPPITFERRPLAA